MFDSKKLIFNEESEKFYEINYKINEYIPKNQNNIIKFAKNDGNFIYQNIDGLMKFYGEVGMTLEDFIYQVLEENIANDFKEKNEELFKCKNFTLKSKFNYVYKYRTDDIEDGIEILFLNLKENCIYIGTGTTLNSCCKLSFKKYNALLKSFEDNTEQLLDINGLIFTYYDERKSYIKFYK